MNFTKMLLLLQNVTNLAYSYKITDLFYLSDRPYEKYLIVY